MENQRGKTSAKNQKLLNLIRERIIDLHKEIEKQRKNRGPKPLIEKLEEAKAMNEVILMKLENRKVTYH